MKALEDGKFLITFPDFEGLTATADSEESIQSVATETIKTKLAEDLKNKATELSNNIPKGSENLFGIIGGVIAIINTFLLAVFSVKIPIFGSYSIGFFKGLGILADFSKEAKNAQAILLFSGILFIAFAGLLIYSSIIKNKNILLYSIVGNAIFLVIFYIILFVKLPGGEAGKYISVSFFKILLYLISLALAFVTYFTLNKAEQNQIFLNNGVDRNEEGF